MYARQAFFVSQVLTFCLRVVEKNGTLFFSPRDLVLIYIKITEN